LVKFVERNKVHNSLLNVATGVAMVVIKDHYIHITSK